MSAETLLSPTRSESRSARARNGILRPSQHPVAVVVVALAGAAVVTGVGFALRSHPFDLALAQALNTLHTGVLGTVTSLVYHGLEPVSAIAITVLATAVIWLSTRRLPVAAAFAGTVAITWIPSDVVKILVHRPRPELSLLSHPFSPVQVDPSFPSGHTVFVTAFVVALVFVLRGTRWMPVGVVAGAVLVLGVGASVSIDAVHYPSDAVASIFWSLTVAPGARVVWADWLMPRIPLLRTRS
ncbi:MAG TPA: phosphatase PAP2 family protein [Microbacterium sp.]|uniref:phosphatase PAP2 family protein n=1 Tax=Microbacterium sp. TaxID=51671 RepID=UPI002B471484|nr:phosphatase PAP2 family protein [Microbacterium sp.]HKT55230.1 phosphatase PAP2 family protein [Microbacterium sp.]